MDGVGIGLGILGATTVTAVLYMMEHGYEWWQIALVIVLATLFAPRSEQVVIKK